MNEMNNENSMNEKSNRPKIERDNKYWLSLEQWSGDPEFLKLAEEEFQSSPLREGSEKEEGWARREFMKLMGASLALATTSCIRRPIQKIVPYNQMPEEVTLGVGNFYTSTVNDGLETIGVLVKTREGRPIKIEGNPKHSINKGGTSARAQASILGLYDPDRLRGPQKNLFNEKRTNKDTIDLKWEVLDASVVEQLKKGSVAMLTGAVESPATRNLIEEFNKAFKVSAKVFNPVSYDDVSAGQKAAYGEEVIPQYHFNKAKMIVSVDADFLGTWLTPVQFTKQFSMARKDIKNMSRLVSFDSSYSLTGANADIRQKIKPSQQIDVVLGLAYEIIVAKGHSTYAGNSTVKNLLSAYSGVAAKLGMEEALFKKIAEDLWENKGNSIVVAGGLAAQTEHAKSLQIAVNFLNSALENDGKTVDGKNVVHNWTNSNGDVPSLIKEMNDGKVKTLIVYKTNPIYALPSSLGFKEALKKVEMVIYIGTHMDEMGNFAHIVATDNHAFESWSDSEIAKGVYTIQQPTIRPMYDTRSAQGTLMAWMKLAKVAPSNVAKSETPYDYIHTYWKDSVFPKVGKGNFDDFWLKALQDGSVGEMATTSSARSFKTDALNSIKKVETSGYELVLYSTIQLGDGQSSNISWLHELPDPITKIVWDNYANVSLATAEKLNLKHGSIIEITVGDKKMELPVNIQPGLHNDVISVAIGYGRTHAGSIANGVGINTYELVNYVNNQAVYSGQTVSVVKTNKKYDLARTQDHHSMEGRQIVVEATLKDYLKKQNANIHKHHMWSFWSGHQYNGHKWAMAIDLNSCTGCNACVISCQSENNIPVVGKKFVMQGREMHWIRIDRYFTGTPENAETVFQPVMCQHCDNAPCETVCPVIATAHSDEGLNDMAYNRCVGTRYCANNCPYKVRRFNWFEYRTKLEKPLQMAHNPDVTVRMRGVMEKCSFCVQRIKEAKNNVRNEGRELVDGDIKTACQTSCPTEAIVFGDVNNPESKVAKFFKEDPRAYALLEEWNAAPSVRYLSKVRNNDKETTQQGEHS